MSSEPAAFENRERDRRVEHIAIFVRSLAGGGGAERVMLNLIGAFLEAGLRVDLVMGRVEGHFVGELPAAANEIDLGTRSARRALPVLWKLPRRARVFAPALLDPNAPWILGAVPALSDYLRRRRPDVLVSALHHANVVALLARELSATDTKTVVTVHNHLTEAVRHSYRPSMRLLPGLIRALFGGADAIVAVSNGVARDIEQVAGLSHESVATVYNPVLSPNVHERAQEVPDHDWLRPGEPPVILGAGKLKPQKDFPTLVRAFAHLRQRHRSRLVILGEGKGRGSLLALARELGVAEDVQLPGFVANPYAYMRRAAVFALSSAWEGFGNVLVEAMAVGCPVVSTDCPSGPAEILADGRYGTLVPVGDHLALGEALAATIDARPDPEALAERAAAFSIRHAAVRYVNVFGELTKSRDSG